ncbi:MAG: hypothetical protein M1839_005600 [Geoglossum umbratile]|nr:MAG: hypothetical protein M1839_005600 [Geoglossum umbratile]
MTDRSDSDIIASKPIEDGLDRFRRLFGSRCKDLGISELRDAPKQVVLLIEAASTDAKDLILDLISTLQVIPTARSLRSRNDRGTLSADLATFYLQLDSNEADVKSVFPLLEQIIGGAPDPDIWNAVFALVTKPRVTPPTVFNKAALDTPLKSTSSSQHGKEQIHKKLDERILQEINCCVYNNTKGFYEKYFEGKSWSSTAEQIVRDVHPQAIDGR